MPIDPKSNAALEVSDQAEYMRLLKEAPIEEFAEYMGGDINMAVQLRIDEAVSNTYDKIAARQGPIAEDLYKKWAAEQETAPAPQMEVTARPITPIGNLVGFASVKFNDAFVVEDFKILQSDKGMFVGMPSKPDKNSTTGYRDTAKPITADFRKELTGAIVTAYHAEVEKLQNRAASVAAPEKPSIQKQLAEGAEQAAKDNTARPKPEKSGKAEKAGR